MLVMMIDSARGGNKGRIVRQHADRCREPSTNGRYPFKKNEKGGLLPHRFWATSNPASVTLNVKEIAESKGFWRRRWRPT